MRSLSLWNDRSPRSLLQSWDLFGREFDRMLTDVSKMMDQPEEERFLTPACDVKETDAAYLMNFDLPGMERDHITVEVHNRDLVVTGERRKEEESKGEDWHRLERHYGKFRRMFTLPENVDLDNIEADYQDGVLKLALPKKEMTGSKKVTIGASNGGFLKRLVHGDKSVSKKKVANE